MTAHVLLWVARPASITDHELLAQYKTVLSPDEEARLCRRTGSLARELLVTRALVRWSLSETTPEIRPATWQFADGAHGKPELVGPAGSPPLFFNVSHSGEVVVCAVTSYGPVGADVEYLERGRRFTQVADRFFAPCEAASVRARAGAEQRAQFYGHWTLKESYIKARGLGISLPLSAFWFEVERGAAPRISFDDRIDDDPGAWQFWQEKIDEQHLAAVAIRCEEGDALSVEVRETTPRFDRPATEPEK